ncbi:unnamed protein product [Closterium sp. NIES-53]
MFDESVPFYCLFPYRSAPLPPPPLFLAPGPPPVDPLPSQGPAPLGVSQEDPPPGAVLREVVVDSSAARGTASWGAEPGGAEPGGGEPGGAETRGVEPGGAETRGAETGGAEPEGVDLGGTVRPRPYFVPLLQQPASPLPAPSPYTKQSGGLTKRLEHASRPLSPVLTARRIPRSCPPPNPGTHYMALCPSSVPLRVPLPAPPESSLPQIPDPESNRARATSPTISCLLATAVTDPSFEFATASALVAELLDFAATRRLDYATALVAVSASANPPFFRGECALCTDVLEDRQEDFECLEAAVPRFDSMLLAPEGDPDLPQRRLRRDYELHSQDFSTTFLQGSLHDKICLRRPPGFTKLFPAGTQWNLRRPVYGLRQVPREWHDTLRTTLAALGFAPSTADPSLFLRTDTSLPPFYVLVYVLQRFGFQFSSPQPTPLSTSHSLSALPSNESVEPSGPYPELVGCLKYLMTCTRPDLAYPLSLLAHYVAPGRHQKVHWDAAKMVLRYLWSMPGMGLVLGGRGPVVLTSHTDASWVDDSATQRLSQGYPFSLGSGSVSWRSTRSSSVLSSSCEAEIYAGAMAAQELRWLTYLLTHFGEQPRSPPQRDQLCLAYVATRANTAVIFTKALPPGDHQRFSTVLGLVPTLPHLLTA